MRIGVMTGGGDCPGLNAVIRAVVRRAVRDHDDEVVGFLDGWRGLVLASLAAHYVRLKYLKRLLLDRE